MHNNMSRVFFLRFVLAVPLLSVFGLTAGNTPIVGPSPNIQATSYILLDATTNKVLAETNADERKAPASLTKIMTGYIVEQEIELGRLGLEEEVQISVNAWRTGGSKMFIREGTRVVVEDLLKGVIIQSGNDASVALAEHIAGSEFDFAGLMNKQAKALGLEDTNFENATGLPDDNHYSTARDLAKLTRALIVDYPQQYDLYSEKYYEYNNIKQPNRNKLLWRDRSVDGVKTGYTQDAGYCLVASAEREGMRLISVVLGTKNDESRLRESQKLLSYGFRNFDTQNLYKARTELQQEPIYYGATEKVALGVLEDVTVTVPRGYYKDIEAKISLPKVLEAPIQAGQQLGNLTLVLAEEVIYETGLVALVDVPEAGIFSRFGDFIFLLFESLFGDD
jgi:D-alanyl-D-alanine carboxypeptidase (penicillin-binding protein 5/6)